MMPMALVMLAGGWRRRLWLLGRLVGRCHLSDVLHNRRSARPRYCQYSVRLLLLLLLLLVLLRLQVVRWRKRR